MHRDTGIRNGDKDGGGREAPSQGQNYHCLLCREARFVQDPWVAASELSAKLSDTLFLPVTRGTATATQSPHNTIPKSMFCVG